MSVCPSGAARADSGGPDRTVCSAYIFDDYRLAERCPHGLSQNARECIPGAAGRRGYHDGDRARWISLRARRERPSRRPAEHCDEFATPHRAYPTPEIMDPKYSRSSVECASQQRAAADVRFGYQDAAFRFVVHPTDERKNFWFAQESWAAAELTSPRQARAALGAAAGLALMSATPSWPTRNRGTKGRLIRLRPA